jgi:hypothetical protein
MTYLLLTQKTANWLLSNSLYLNAIKKELPNIVAHKALADGVMVVGSLRAAALRESLCVWNTDYLTGTGYEDWGIITIQGPIGLFTELTILGEVFERQLYVINQRLQGLLLADDRFIHRSLGENLHTCLAGRGDRARQYSIGWYEGEAAVGPNRFHTLITIGPSSIPGDAGFEVMKKHLTDAKGVLPKLIADANSLLRLSLSRPTLDISAFVGLADRFSPVTAKRHYVEIPIEEAPELEADEVAREARYSTLEWTYAQWVKPDSPLSRSQRLILEADTILRQPLRIIGPAGSGKTLLMQLLAMRQLGNAEVGGRPLSILYVVHNSEMQSVVWKRFETLGGMTFLEGDKPQKLYVNTLFEYCRNQIEFPSDAIIDKDALQTKLFQKQIVTEAIGSVFEKRKPDVKSSVLLNKLSESQALIEVLSDLIVSEIGIAIKGRGLTNDRGRYVESERPFTRFHSVLNSTERDLVFDVFEAYHHVVFHEYEVLDADDVAISLLGQLKTPLWEMKRKKVGFDMVFVDETQLFNQNERQLFRFLPKLSDQSLPIAIALDEAQEVRGSTSAGFGILGIEDMANETLSIVHRCTPDILRLAFFVIQRTTDLFGSEFPDFTQNTTTVIPQDHPLAEKPRLVVRDESPTIGKSVLREIRTLRRNLRQIAVVVHSDKYWGSITDFLKTQQIPLLISSRRGERIDPRAPVVYVSKPENIGGQEFDAVICVGLEHGVVPPLIDGHIGLSEALEQQSLREMYLAFTRSRYRLIILNSKHSTPNHIIQMAIEAGMIEGTAEGSQGRLDFH